MQHFLRRDWLSVVQLRLELRLAQRKLLRILLLGQAFRHLQDLLAQGERQPWKLFVFVFVFVVFRCALAFFHFYYYSLRRFFAVFRALPVAAVAGILFPGVECPTFVSASIRV